MCKEGIKIRYILEIVLGMELPGRTKKEAPRMRPRYMYLDTVGNDSGMARGLTGEDTRNSLYIGDSNNQL